MPALTNKGTGYTLSATTAAVNTNTGTNQEPTWQFTNAAGNVAVVNVYTSNVSVTANTGIAVPAGATQVVAGDFGHGWQGNVWISVILTAGSGTVYAAPVFERS